MRAIVLVAILVFVVPLATCDDDVPGRTFIDEDDFDDEHDTFEPSDAQVSSGERLLNHILDEVDRGHVTREKISHWMTQIKVALDDGELTQAQVDEFNATMRTKLAASTDSGTCCPFG